MLAQARRYGMCTRLACEMHCTARTHVGDFSRSTARTSQYMILPTLYEYHASRLSVGAALPTPKVSGLQLGSLPKGQQTRQKSVRKRSQEACQQAWIFDEKKLVVAMQIDKSQFTVKRVCRLVSEFGAICAIFHPFSATQLGQVITKRCFFHCKMPYSAF